MDTEARIETLTERHSTLDAQIAAEHSRPKPDYDLLRSLKVEKLRLKDTITRMLD